MMSANIEKLAEKFRRFEEASRKPGMWVSIVYVYVHAVYEYVRTCMCMCSLWGGTLCTCLPCIYNYT